MACKGFSSVRNCARVWGESRSKPCDRREVYENVVVTEDEHKLAKVVTGCRAADLT